MSLLDLIHAKRTEILALGAEYGISNLRVFGSVARGEENEESDVDFLATLSEKTSLFDLMTAEIHMENLLNHRVEISADDSLTKPVLQTAMRDAQQI